MTSTTRRAVLAGFVAAPVVDIWAPAPDPIFRAIEAHRAAYETWALAVGNEACLNSDHPDCAAADRITREAWDAFEATGVALANIEPATPAGVLALLDYIDRFNHAAFAYPSGYSSHQAWPWSEAEEDIRIGAPIVLPFPYLVMNNIRAAVAKLA